MHWAIIKSCLEALSHSMEEGSCQLVFTQASLNIKYRFDKHDENHQAPKCLFSFKKAIGVTGKTFSQSPVVERYLKINRKM
jgi:hypothetical protein